MSGRGKGELVTLMLMTLTTAFWGGSFVAGKIALREFPPMTLTFFRFLIATTVILPYMWYTDETRVPNREDIPVLFGLGFLGVSGYFTFQFTSLLYTSAGNSATINALIPLTASVLATFMTEERLNARKVALIFLAFSGVMLTATGGDIDILMSLEFNKGDLIMILAMLCFSVYGIYSRKMTTKYTPILVTAYIFLFGLIQITPLMLMEGVFGEVLSYSWEAWAAVAFMAFFSSVLGYMFQQSAIQKLGINRTMLFFNLVPLFAILFAYLILGDPVTPVNLISAGIITTAVLLNSRVQPVDSN
ncbi:DMT family transporter [Candidatus Bathyarchaeota archaeon]|nr:DMT family transporter [Candidatus Bathyarchaeota archaeon]MBT7347545.1 DMT family transporter [Candidatus Bathyarchaeota archaeon]